MDAQVVAAWFGIAVSGSVALGALIVSVRGLRYQRMSAEASLRAAEATERAAEYAERAQHDVAVDGRTVETDEGVIELSVPDVKWDLTRVGKAKFVLRNVGTATATGVRIDETEMTGIPRMLPKDAVIRGGAAVDFLIFGAWGSPVPSELLVHWDGREEPDVVPVP